MELTVLILTPLPLEYAAVIKQVDGNLQSVVKDGTAYSMGFFQGKHYRFNLVVCEPGMKNIDMALAVEKAIIGFNPHIALLIGIAAGVKDVNIGDVLIAKKAYSYDSGKEDQDRFMARPAAESFSPDLLAYAQIVSRNNNWKYRIDHDASDARVLFGPIAAGDKVVASTANPTYQRIKQYYNDTLGLEMEAFGFATAIQKHRHIHGLVIRGISDLCEGKAEADSQGYQLSAAERSAAFAFEVLSELKNLNVHPHISSTISLSEFSAKNSLIDAYFIQARLLPAIITSLPMAYFYWYIVKPLTSSQLSNLSYLLTAGNYILPMAGIILLIQVNRFISKEIFQRWYFKDEMEMPTTDYLLHKSGYYPVEIKAMLREKIKNLFLIDLYSPEEEHIRESDARKQIVFAVSQIRKLLYKNEMLIRHNIEYGLLRNCLGGCVTATFFSILGIIFSFQLSELKESEKCFYVLFSIYSLPLLFSKYIVKIYGSYYAKILYEQFLSYKNN